MKAINIQELTTGFFGSIVSCLKIFINPKLFMQSPNYFFPVIKTIDKLPDSYTVDKSIEHVITYPSGEVPKSLVSILRKHKNQIEKIAC